MGQYQNPERLEMKSAPVAPYFCNGLYSRRIDRIRFGGKRIREKLVRGQAI